MKRPKLVRISTVPHSLYLLLKGQMAYMSDNGYEVIMMSSYSPDVQELERQEDCKWVEVPITRRFNVWSDIRSLFFLIKLFRKLKPDIVHSHSPKAGTVGQLAACFCHVPLRIHTVAGLPLLETSGFKRLILDFVERITYKCAHWVLPNSRVQGDYLIDNKYVRKRKIKIIGKGSSNGIDLEYFKMSEHVKRLSTEKKAEWGLTESDFIICFVGRLASYKGINELVSAHLKLKDSIPQIKLVLVGPFEDLNPLEKDTLSAIHQDCSIFFTGHVKDVRPYLAMSDLFVFPSYREGFPQSLMQACAMGLPCIATNINGCNEIIVHNENGLLINSKSDEEIMEALICLYNDSSKRRRMAMQSRKRMQQNYDQNSFWGQLLKFYNTHLK